MIKTSMEIKGDFKPTCSVSILKKQIGSKSNRFHDLNICKLYLHGATKKKQIISVMFEKELKDKDSLIVKESAYCYRKVVIVVADDLLILV